ncbi:hypothetical protein [Ectopseudomonas alcaliphila]|uniref:hypothetical protein n=1 Tax=Ectopseudomonas alcaliphila TaxID=101564 RepID=UPI0027845261|nr:MULTISPECIES: hypothetical protein [Pseudomonas]MDP9938700.1 superfamily II DNA helicase RecQ [Pseudomonas sp. 3400]MDR7010923.1 superfamily II DNA helicase RecQ [Pseudomonas alcaliphila]
MSTLKRVFGFDQLRPGQEAVISEVGRTRRRQYAIAAPGAGCEAEPGMGRAVRWRS